VSSINALKLGGSSGMTITTGLSGGGTVVGVAGASVVGATGSTVVGATVDSDGTWVVALLQLTNPTARITKRHIKANTIDRFSPLIISFLSNSLLD